MKYVIKRVLIGVILFLIISFLKSKNVFAYTLTYRLGLETCTNSSGNLFCSNNESIKTLGSGTFSIPKNTFIKNVYQDYQNVNISNTGSSTKYYRIEVGVESFFLPTDLSQCPDINDNTNTHYKSAAYLSPKNMRVVACTYTDNLNQEHDCYDFFYTDRNNLLTYRNFVREDSWSDIEGSKGYFRSSYWSQYNSAVNDYFGVPAGVTINNLYIKLGGVGSYVGKPIDLYSGRDNNFWSNYYIDYPIINGCTYSNNSTLTFNRTSWYNNTRIGFEYNDTYQPYGQSLVSNGSIVQNNIQEFEQEMSGILSESEIKQEFVMQDRLIGYDEENEEQQNNDLFSQIAGSLNGALGTTPQVFTNFLALPINLLNENKNYEPIRDVTGSGGLSCTSYASEYLPSNNANITGVVNLTIPFTHNVLTLDCFNSNVLSPYNKYFGSFYNNNDSRGLDRILAPIYHIVLTGLLSYRLIISYFKLIKETYDPEDNSVEVLDL